jgi:hypothetical protein
MRHRFYGVQNDHESVVLFNYINFEAGFGVGQYFVLECFWYGNKHSFIRVGVFSVEVRFLCYVMVDFDGWFPFFGHFC